MSAEQLNSQPDPPEWAGGRLPWTDELFTKPDMLLPDEASDQVIVEMSAKFKMLGKFYDHCYNEGIDPRTHDPADAPGISHAAHRFLHQATERMLVKFREKNPGRDVYPGLLRYESIEKGIDDYYARFGLDRRGLSKSQRRQADEFAVGSKAALDDHQNAFPEILPAREMEALLRRQGHQIAADGLETVLIAYGQRVGKMYKFQNALRDFEERHGHRIYESHEIWPYSSDE